MKTKYAVFATALGVWCLLCWPVDFQQLVGGCLAAGIVTYVTADLFGGRVFPLRNPGRYVHFAFRYVPLFLWECLKANVDVAWRVVHPRLPIRPGIVKVTTTLESDVGLTFLANSITLTPGTMTVDIDREKGVLYVHWIDVRSTDIEIATELIVRRFERVLRNVFD